MIHDYLLKKSYRSFDVNKNYLNKLVLFFARLLPEIDTFNSTYQFQFSGRYGLDGIWIPMEGSQYVILIILDLESLDIVNYHIADKENTFYWEWILEDLKDCEYLLSRTEFFISDGKGGISRALKKLFKDTPRQVCKAHKLMRLRSIFPRRKINNFVRLWYLLARRALSSKNTEDYTFWKRSIINVSKLKLFYQQEEVDRERLSKTLGTLNYQEKDFTLQFRQPGLVDNVTTNNALEGVNSFLSSRIRLFRGLKKFENAEQYIKLLIYFYRFHRFKTSKYQFRNGKAPLEITPCLEIDRLDEIIGKQSYSWIQNMSKFSNLPSHF